MISINNVIASVMNACESEFYLITLNTFDKEWDNLLTKTNITSSENLNLITDYVVQQPEDISVFNLLKDNRFNKKEVTVNGKKINNLFCTPLIAKKGLTIGSICILNTKPKQFTEHQILMINMLARDITLQADILERDSKLLKAAKCNNILNKELDEFTHVASHDLSSPLNAIQNLVSWIEEDTNEGNTEDNPQNFKMVKKRIERMRCLLKDLGNYSRISSINTKFECFNFKTLITECCEALETTEQFEIQVDDIDIVFSKQSLTIIFEHLISNAILHHHLGTGTIIVKCCVDSNNYKFSVIDDGPGIDQKYHERIFLPFKSLKSKDEMEASGLGLAIVKKIVDIHGGNITLESKKGIGTTFNIALPRIET